MRTCTLLGFFIVAGCGAIAGCGAGQMSSLDTGAGPGSAEPHLAVGPNGATVLSFLEPTAAGVALNYSVLGADGWSSPSTVAHGDNWFVNWADFPSVEPLTETRWAAHWLVKMDGGQYAYNAMVAVSEDVGETWGEPMLLHTDGSATEHGFVSLYPTSGGVGAVWLDGRKMSGGHGNQPLDPKADQGGSFAGMQLRSVSIRNGALQNKSVVDGLVCDCCQTDVALTQTGPVVVYRNRTANEVRDIYVARHVGGVWQAGVPVASDGWQIKGCPVNGPAIAVHGSTVAVAWYTQAQTTGGQSNRVQLALSMDNGQSFGEPIGIQALDPIGRVDVVVLADNSAVVSWVERGVGQLLAQRVFDADTLEEPLMITPMETNRGAGFPQMVAVPQGLMFAWTDTTADQSRVRSLLVSL